MGWIRMLSIHESYGLLNCYIEPLNDVAEYNVWYALTECITVITTNDHTIFDTIGAKG